MTCYLCNCSEASQVPGRVRDLPQTKIWKCDNCKLVFLENFSHIYENFYEDNQMYKGDVDDPLFQLKETRKDDIRRFEYLKELICNKRVLDFGCAYGGFLNLAKEVTTESAGIEASKKARDIVAQSGLEIYQTPNDIPSHKEYDIITLFHVLEHLPDPRSILKELASRLAPGGSLIVEVPNSRDVLLEIYDNKMFADFTYWSCHLMLYNSDNLGLLFEQCNLEKKYIKQIQRYSLANHLNWLIKGAPRGHEELDFLNSSKLHEEYEKQLASIGCCDTLIARVQKKDMN